MSKFASNRAATPPSPFGSVAGTVFSAMGAPSFKREPKGELFAFAASNMVGEPTFHEDPDPRDARFRSLVRECTIADPAWVLRLTHWLRTKGNMRSASVVMAAEAVRTRTEAKIGAPIVFREEDFRDEDTAEFLRRLPANVGSQAFLIAGVQRLDEVREVLGYWTGRYGKKLPKPLKKGLAERVTALTNEYSYAKYGAPEDAASWHLADAIDLLGPIPRDEAQSALFRYALEERHGRKTEPGDLLTQLVTRRALTTMPKEAKTAFLASPEALETIQRSGITWEALSGWYGGPLTASFWESVIPKMPIMALIRNLSNFERSNVSATHRKMIVERLTDPEQIRRSKQFPYRFLSALRAVQGDYYTSALSEALDLSVGSIPRLRGRTLILADTSASMRGRVSEKSQIRHIDVAGLIASALANKAQANGDQVDFYGFADGVFEHQIPRGQSVRATIEAFGLRVGHVGHGTQIAAAVQRTLKGHDRLIIVSDEQAYGANPYRTGRVEDVLPDALPTFAVNTAGYEPSMLNFSKPNRFQLAGFSDQVFRSFEHMVGGQTGNWPF